MFQFEFAYSARVYISILRISDLREISPLKCEFSLDDDLHSGLRHSSISSLMLGYSKLF
jgi:hypothetical protein